MSRGWEEAAIYLGIEKQSTQESSSQIRIHYQLGYLNLILLDSYPLYGYKEDQTNLDETTSNYIMKEGSTNFSTQTTGIPSTLPYNPIFILLFIL